MNRIKEILLFIWQLPQAIIGLILFAWYRSSITECTQYCDSTIFCATRMKGGISLSPFIICSPGAYINEKSKAHERGHIKQSIILGPFYLLIIGIPSIIWAITYKNDKQNPNGYYKFYTEKWADKLGNVIRD